MPKIYGLYLAGGQSSRMGSPKWALAHTNGKRFIDYATEQLAEHCEQVFISTATQNSEIDLPQICDDQYDTTDVGPLGGLLAAHKYDPEASWLLLACDLPAISASDLETFLSQDGDIIAYKNPIDDVPEATATLYHPNALQKLAPYLSGDSNSCMRNFLETHNLTALKAPSYYALQNVNYPADYTEWQKRSSANYNTPSLSVVIEYYAKLKQDAGMDKTNLETNSITIAGLWEECRFKHNLSLKLPNVKPAANNSFVDWDYELQSGDTIAFMPPFAGG